MPRKEGPSTGGERFKASASQKAQTGIDLTAEGNNTPALPPTLVSVNKEGLARFGGNFDLLDQNGHFRIPESPFTINEARRWRGSLTTGERIEFNTLRTHVLELFGIESLPHIRNVIADPERKEERTIEANRILAKRFGIQGSDEFIKGKIEEYRKAAISERREVAATLGKTRAFGLSNKAATTSNVLELLEIAFFNKDKKNRFEAGKILDGMESAAEADRIRRDEETTRFLASPHTSTPDSDRRDIEEDPDIAEINAILDSNFYNSEPPEEATLILSKHAPDNFRTIGIKQIRPQEARIARFKKPPGRHLYTELPERTITHNGVDTPAYVHIRKKSVESTVRKGKRKGTKNLRKAVEDAIGMRIVIPNMEDVPSVHEELVKAFNLEGHSFTILELQDSLSGGSYRTSSPGSSEKLKVINILAQIGPWIAEIQYFDRAAFIDSTAQNEVAREEFALNRLYESGVPQHDFPEYIYGQPHDQIKKSRTREIRDGIKIGLFRDEPDL